MIRRGEAALHICETRKGNVMKYYQTANSYCRRIFGSKVYKLALSAAETCPNRDGTVGYGGCMFAVPEAPGISPPMPGSPLRRRSVRRGRF